jgi:hypothetical protein
MSEWNPYKTRPAAYKSLVTGNVFEYGPGKYSNHGYGGIKTVFNPKTKEYEEYQDLPADEYPYTILYEDPVLSKPAWMR